MPLFVEPPWKFDFNSYVRLTKWAAQFVLALRSEILIKAAVRFTGLHWETVKNIEKSWLEKKYKKIRLGEVECLGIDEVYLGRIMGYIYTRRLNAASLGLTYGHER